MADYSALCLNGSKECTRIHELAYADLDQAVQLEVAHGAFAFLAFAGAIGPMFVVNLWIAPESTRYKTSVKDNSFQDFWRLSYLFYAILYGAPAIMTPFTYAFEVGDLKRMYEAWWGTWNIVMMSGVLLVQIVMFWPSDYYLGDFPWEVMFVYAGVYLLHLGIWEACHNNLHRWAYGIDAVPPESSLDGEHIDYCCLRRTAGAAGTGETSY